MRRAAISFVAATLMLTALPASATETPRAMWVWDEPSQEIVDFSAERGIDRIFLHVGPGFSSNPAVDSFLISAQSQGIQVYALAGDPSWAKRSRPFLNWVDEVVSHGGFDGLAPDIEPYALSDWNNWKRRSRLIARYLGALEDAHARAGSLPLIPAVPFWWDEPEFAVKGSLLIDEVLNRVDGIAVMAYRDTAQGPNGIIRLAEYEVAAGSAAGKSVTIGVETAPNRYDHVTFHEEGSAVMESVLVELVAEWGTSSGYWGNAIHHYGSYVGLKP